ncbi:MAG: hypothetical protein C0501_04365 [Isosphaera sp.]|nr:hypothetical protein [Isosphaera sp.]
MAEAPPDDWWPDEEYVPYLEAEQRLYAWVLVKVGGVEPDEATRRAVARFHYEPIDRRGIMTHEGAWRVAMADLFGNHARQPAEFGLASEYEAELRRLFHHDE